ncbi:MAG: hypothetical protein PQJ61_13995 [Spirochaetales bacterium]|uniref:DUF4139 domain-containing protein n=1 Tax=Candidatus Thalassospirochaeta sargassi TaxID=3119039 RepID=A0AAJ1IH76_9SPIO|nr:hypothetical protein [Spirochaetales bacterium]
MNRLSLYISVLFILALPVLSSGEGVSEVSEAAVAASEIPVSRVTLYSAGLAQMVHETEVNGNEEILFQAEPGDINDILKSLVVEDLDGGSVDIVKFDSADPLNIVLGDLRVNPSGSPALYDLLLRAQGEWVAASGNDKDLEGRILSVEKRQTDDELLLILNLMNSSGINSIDITELKNLQFIDPLLQNELISALGTISESRIKSVRTLRISFKGKGFRRVRLSYIKAVPLWKTSYRIVLDENGTPTLEGWAIVQNTGNTDWENVQLDFVAGMPNAFTMELSTPKYISREDVDTVLNKPIGPTSYEKAYAPAPSMSRSSYDMPSSAMAEEAYSPAPTASLSTAVSSGNFYRYEVSHPVTIDARSSAMIPIISYENAGKSLGVYDPSYNLVFKGIQLTNISEAQWEAGPVTVLEGRYYGGDTLLPAMIPDSERLLTYAVHGSLEVEKEIISEPEVLSSIKISDGLLYRSDKKKRKTEYKISGTEDELLIIHPRESGWKLLQSPEISEETTGEYRFRLTEWDKPAVVSEEYIELNQYSLINLGLNDFDYYMEWNHISPDIKRAFDSISKMKREIETLREQINNLNSSVNRISRDQSRIRENMKVLDKESDLYKKYSLQLEDQEKDLTELYSNQTATQRKYQEADRKLKDYIAGLDLE